MPDSVRQKSCSDCEGWYLPVAENLVAGNGLEVGVEKRPALDRPPGHVVLLAGLFWVLPNTLVDRETAIYAYNILLLALSCLILFSISKVYWGGRLALFTAAAWMSSPFVLWFLGQPYSEVPFFSALFFAAWMMLTHGVRPLLGTRQHLTQMTDGNSSFVRFCLQQTAKTVGTRWLASFHGIPMTILRVCTLYWTSLKTCSQTMGCMS